MATSQYTLTPAQHMARALNAQFPLRHFAALQAAREVEFVCSECGSLDGAPVSFYDSGDASVGYGGEEIECCTLCVRSLKAVR